MSLYIVIMRVMAAVRRLRGMAPAAVGHFRGRLCARCSCTWSPVGSPADRVAIMATAILCVSPPLLRYSQEGSVIRLAHSAGDRLLAGAPPILDGESRQRWYVLRGCAGGLRPHHREPSSSRHSSSGSRPYEGGRRRFADRVHSWCSSSSRSCSPRSGHRRRRPDWIPPPVSVDAVRSKCSDSSLPHLATSRARVWCWSSGASVRSSPSVGRTPTALRAVVWLVGADRRVDRAAVARQDRARRPLPRGRRSRRCTADRHGPATGSAGSAGSACSHWCSLTWPSFQRPSRDHTPRTGVRRRRWSSMRQARRRRSSSSATHGTWRSTTGACSRTGPGPDTSLRPAEWAAPQRLYPNPDHRARYSTMQASPTASGS